MTKKTNEATTPKNAIYVGPSVDSINAARDAILSFMNTGCEEKTKRVAIEALKGLCEVKNTSISNCNFDMG